MGGVTRHLFPRRLTIRWFATRGWALGGFVAFTVAATLLRPVNLPVDSRFLAIVFANAAAAFGCLSWRPESHIFRLWVVGAAVFSALTRSFALFLADEPSFGTRCASAVVWLFVAYCCWLLATFTANTASRER